MRTRRLAIFILGGLMAGCHGTRPSTLGVTAGTLRPCPDTPNCVSSEEGTPTDKRVDAFPAPGGAADVVRLSALLAAWPRTEVITSRPGYLHAEVTTLIMRFRDDVEFRFDSASSRIHVRSASRLGKSDLGVNRKRVDGLRARWMTTAGGGAQ